MANPTGIAITLKASSLHPALPQARISLPYLPLTGSVLNGLFCYLFMQSLTKESGYMTQRGGIVRLEHKIP